MRGLQKNATDGAQQRTDGRMDGRTDGRTWRGMMLHKNVDSKNFYGRFVSRITLVCAIYCA